MKSSTRVTIRPGKSVVVSNEMMARARGALEAFGVTEADLERLAAFKGDVTIGPRRGLVRPTKAKMPCMKRVLKTGEVVASVAGQTLKTGKALRR